MRKVVCRCIIKDASESRGATAVAAAADFPEPFNVAEIFVGDLLRTKERTNRRRGNRSSIRRRGILKRRGQPASHRSVRFPALTKREG